MTSGKPRSIFDRLYASRQFGGPFLPSVEPTYRPLLPRSANQANQLFRNHYEQKFHGRRINKPQQVPQKKTTEGIPPLLSVQPQPLFDPKTIEKLRASLNSVSNALNQPPEESPDNSNQYDPFDEDNQESDSVPEQESEPTPADEEAPESKDQLEDADGGEEDPKESVKEELDVDEYLQKERETKKQIDDIIMVAQALREKLNREEEIKLQALEIIRPPADGSSKNDQEPPSKDPATPKSPPIANSLPEESTCATSQPEIPRLMDLPPVRPIIPSLLDINVPPPPVEHVLMENRMTGTGTRYKIQPGLIDICWNCERRGHSHVNCRLPKLRKFCFRCGMLGYNLASCPYCNRFCPQ